MQVRILVGLLIGTLSVGQSAYAQVTVDGSTSTQVQGNVIAPFAGGTVRGGNLYHSFREFNVPATGISFGALGSSFIDGARIDNIINRVTGNTPSSILGRIESSQTFPRANIFLLNPNGIVFGSNASLNIGGSFYATTATSIGFRTGDVLDSNINNRFFPSSNPADFRFAVDRPAAIINQANLAVKPGGNISLAGGSVISTGNLNASNGSIDIASVPGNSTLILRSPDFIIGIEVRPGVVANRWVGRITELPQLASLLTGQSSVSEASKVVVNPDGSLQLVANSTPTELSTFLLPNGQFDIRGSLDFQRGDVAVKALSTGDVQVVANRNLALLTPNLQSSRSISLRAGNSLIVRDSTTSPATIKAGSNLTLRGDRSIDILALNFPQPAIESGGNITLRSDGNVLGDSNFSSSGSIFVRTSLGTAGSFLSALNFTLGSDGNIQFLPSNNSPGAIRERISAYRNILTIDSRAADVVNRNLAPSSNGVTPTDTQVSSNSAASGNQSSVTTNGNSGSTTSTSATPGSQGSQNSNTSSGTSKGTSTTVASSNPVGILGSASGLAIQAGLSTLNNLSNLAYSGSPVNSPLSNAADLLLQEGRILEAQQTLDLSIVKELEGYLGKVAASKTPTAIVANLSTDRQQLYSNYQAIQERLIQLDRELSALYRVPESERSMTQKGRITELVALQEIAKKEFERFIDRPDVAALAREISEATLKKLQADLRALDRNAVLLYPLIREDRLELILISPDSPPVRRTAFVSRSELYKEIEAFRYALETVYDPSADASVPGRKLYEWLIKPVEDDLLKANAKTILYAPYAQLRYVPIAALHDGKEWLVQRFRINNITAASLQDFSVKPQLPRNLLAGAATQAASVKIGNRAIAFSGLPFAGREVENVTAIIPNSTKLLDKDFSPASTAQELKHHSLIHMATHAEFRPGKPEDSFIMFGNGDRMTLADVRLWSMKNVDLVVLSACETALGAVLGNGEEILGFGYIMQESGARAAIASLWSVDDGGTQALMDIFYTMLKKPNVTTAEALRQAQITLITGDYSALGTEGETVKRNIQNRLPVNVTEYLNHPNYWAPFIIIGNGL